MSFGNILKRFLAVIYTLFILSILLVLSRFAGLPEYITILLVITLIILVYRYCQKVGYDIKKTSGMFFVIVGAILLIMPVLIFFGITKSESLGLIFVGIIFIIYSLVGAIFGLILLLIGWLLLKKRKK